MPAHAACKAGDVAALTAALSGGAAVEGTDRDGNTPLHEACKFGAAECVRFLLSKGASVEARGVNAVTPLICAAGSNSPETVELLLDAGADVNICSKQGTSALMYAAMNGRPECAKLLLAKGADATLRSGLGRTALHFAASGPSGKEDVAHVGDYPAVASLLLAANGIDVDAQDADGWTPLYSAAAVGQTEMLKLLRQHGADVNKRDAGTGAMPIGATPLHQACAGRHADCVKELVKAGADEFAQDKLKRTPRDALPDAFMGEPSFQACQWCLENAAKIDETACGQLGRLLQKDTAVDVQAVLSFFDKTGNVNALDINAQLRRLEDRTALNFVAFKKGLPQWSELVREFIALGADVNLESAGEPPLFTAAHNGNTEMARLLLDAGANANWTRGGKYLAGYTPLMAALYHKHEDTALALLEKGAAFDTVLTAPEDEAGYTPLHLAVKAQSLAVTKAIVERGGPGADVYARAGRGGMMTPLELAGNLRYSSGDASICDYLVSVAPPPPPPPPPSDEVCARCVIS